MKLFTITETVVNTSATEDQINMWYACILLYQEMRVRSLGASARANIEK